MADAVASSQRLALSQRAGHLTAVAGPAQAFTHRPGEQCLVIDDQDAGAHAKMLIGR